MGTGKAGWYTFCSSKWCDVVSPLQVGCTLHIHVDFSCQGVYKFTTVTSINQKYSLCHHFLHFAIIQMSEEIYRLWIAWKAACWTNRFKEWNWNWGLVSCWIYFLPGIKIMFLPQLLSVSAWSSSTPTSALASPSSNLAYASSALSPPSSALSPPSSALSPPSLALSPPSSALSEFAMQVACTAAGKHTSHGR